LGMAERVGFEPTVPLPRRMLSKHVDSSTLAPLRNDCRKADLSMHSQGRQGADLTVAQRFSILPKTEEVSAMKVIVGLLIVLVLLVGSLLALPFLVDLASYQDQYKPLIENALNRKIQLQGIRL